MNCAISGGYTAASIKDIAMQLALKGIYEEGDYSIFPVKIGEYEHFTVKYKASPVCPIYEDLSEAIKEFLKLTSTGRL